MDIEHNEAKIHDVTIPIFELEQKVFKLEQNFTAFQVESVGRLADQISFKLNNQMSMYLPEMQKLKDEFYRFKSLVQIKFTAGHTDNSSNHQNSLDTSSEFQQLKFLVNSSLNEVRLMK